MMTKYRDIDWNAEIVISMRQYFAWLAASLPMILHIVYGAILMPSTSKYTYTLPYYILSISWRANFYYRQLSPTSAMMRNNTDGRSAAFPCSMIDTWTNATAPWRYAFIIIMHTITISSINSYFIIRRDRRDHTDIYRFLICSYQ